AVARTLAPHDTLADAAYALVVKAIDAECARDPATLAMLRDGLARLGPAFATTAEAARVSALTAVESTAFFRYLRYQTLSNLYASPIAYAHFGYEGESFSKGGYLQRGFNDLRWLPEVPLTDSGPVFTGATR
ncbi:MAG: tat (twin-arginine translocation) pathway signal sequence, partial [Steroidobacteraceae bacterium]